MSAPPPVAVRASLVNRVKAILMQPKSEWQVIDGEPATIASIYMGYVVPLAAIPAICGAVWMARYTPGFAVRYAVTQYVLGLVTPFVFALIIDALAPTFGGQRSQIQALKVAAYSWTAAWVAGILLLIPGLGVLSIVGLYSLYLLYLGLPVLMKSPADRAMSYTVVAIIIGVVLAVVVNRVAWMVMGGGSAFYGVYR
jgi:Yip1 domain